MKYIHSKTGQEIDLSKLTKPEKDFFEEASDKFKNNCEWIAFEEFVFGPLSPIYCGVKSHLEVFKNPLYLALEDMWLQLGRTQGKVRN